MSLTYEPSSEPLHISAKKLALYSQAFVAWCFLLQHRFLRKDSWRLSHQESVGMFENDTQSINQIILESQLPHKTV